jgi:ribonuclease HI
MTFEIYCDGSTKGNGKENSVGAWAWLVHEGGNLIKKDCQAETNTTNQRMELTAAAEALDYVVNNIMGSHDRVVVYTDSAYLHNCYQQKWYKSWQANGWKNAKKQPVANQDLWEMLIPYFEIFGIDFVKVKGHAGNMWNEYVDDIAQTAAARLQEKMNGNSNN